MHAATHARLERPTHAHANAFSLATHAVERGSSTHDISTTVQHQRRRRWYGRVAAARHASAGMPSAPAACPSAPRAHEARACALARGHALMSTRRRFSGRYSRGRSDAWTRCRWRVDRAHDELRTREDSFMRATCGQWTTRASTGEVASMQSDPPGRQSRVR